MTVDQRGVVAAGEISNAGVAPAITTVAREVADFETIAREAVDSATTVVAEAVIVTVAEEIAGAATGIIGAAGEISGEEIAAVVISTGTGRRILKSRGSN
jgi:hypothetical protein